MTREQFLAMIEASPNKAALKASYDAQEASRQQAIPDVPVYPKGLKAEEKELQRSCEGLLRQWGYRPSTAPEVVASLKPDATPVKGWYIHLWNCRNNPVLPDLLIFDESMRRSIAIELKCASVYQDGQREFIQRGSWHEVRTFLDFKEKVEIWEACK